MAQADADAVAIEPCRKANWPHSGVVEPIMIEQILDVCCERARQCRAQPRGRGIAVERRRPTAKTNRT